MNRIAPHAGRIATDKTCNGELTITCRNRHCPKCQGAPRERWLTERTAELLPVPYFHVVFTLPQQLAPLALQNKRIVYGILFQAVSETLLEVAVDPKHLGAEVGLAAQQPFNFRVKHGAWAAAQSPFSSLRRKRVTV